MGWDNHSNYAWEDNYYGQGQNQGEYYDTPQYQEQQHPFLNELQKQQVFGDLNRLTQAVEALQNPFLNKLQRQQALLKCQEDINKLTQVVEAFQEKKSQACKRDFNENAKSFEFEQEYPCPLSPHQQSPLQKMKAFQKEWEYRFGRVTIALEDDDEGIQIEVEEPHMEEEEYVENLKDEETTPYAQIEEEERAQPQVTYARVGYVYIQHENFSKEEADSQESLSQTMEWTHLDPNTPTEGCSERLPIITPSSIQDQGRISKPCTIENFNSMALCDLSVSANPMPLSTYEQFGVESMKPTKVALLVGDTCEKLPRNKFECVFDKVDNLNYSTKSIILQKYEDVVKLMRKLEFNTHTYLSNVMKVALWIMPWTND